MHSLLTSCSVVIHLFHTRHIVFSPIYLGQIENLRVKTMLHTYSRQPPCIILWTPWLCNSCSWLHPEPSVSILDTPRYDWGGPGWARDNWVRQKNLQLLLAMSSYLLRWPRRILYSSYMPIINHVASQDWPSWEPSLQIFRSPSLSLVGLNGYTWSESKLHSWIFCLHS